MTSHLAVRSLTRRPFVNRCAQCNRSDPMRLLVRCGSRLRDGRRSFADVVDLDDSKSSIGTAKAGIYSGTILAKNAARTTISQLLDQITSDPLSQEIDRPSSPSLLALLFTPTYAQQALDPDVSLQLLQKLQDDKGSNEFTKDLHTFTAIVDKLPSVRGPSTGLEGLSFLFLRNMRPADSLPTPLNPSAEKSGSVIFDIPTRGSEGTQYQIQVPLAHTVFSTGLPSTLHHRFYRYNAQSKQLQVDKANQLESANIGLPSFDYDTIHFPLVPLTPFRVVKTSMGNIIRTISSVPTFDKSSKSQTEVPPQPASQELEAVISQYFKKLDISPEPIEVWALIVPAPDSSPGRTKSRILPSLSMRKYDSENIPSMWGANIDALRFMEHNEGIRQVLIGGGRLCKVLSGGGGWGKKAGLLSLDPDTAYSTRTLRGDEGWQFDFSGDSAEATERQKREALGQIVKEGESIMFLVQGRGKFPLPSGDEENQPARSAVFGPIPSTMDILPDPSSEGSSESAELLSQPGFFGALSETGLAVTIKTTSKSGAAAVHSKIDTPFSLFCAHARKEDGE